jgi:phage shock protein A
MNWEEECRALRQEARELRAEMERLRQVADDVSARARRLEDVSCNHQTENETLRRCLGKALRKWMEYAALVAEVDLEHDDTADALLFRSLLASANQQRTESP